MNVMNMQTVRIRAEATNATVCLDGQAVENCAQVRRKFTTLYCYYYYRCTAFRC